MTSRKCYLICSDVALRGRGGCAVSHYIGHTGQERLTDRLARHVRGDGAKITRAFVAESGILTVTRVWAGGWREEKALKRYANAARLCTRCCGPEAMRRGPRGMRRGKSLWPRDRWASGPVLTSRTERTPPPAFICDPACDCGACFPFKPEAAQDMRTDADLNNGQATGMVALPGEATSSSEWDDDLPF